MVSDDITIGVRFVDQDPGYKERKKKEFDEVRDEWAQTEREIAAGLRDMQQGISITIQFVQMFARATGRAITPAERAVLSMINSTANMMVSTAAAMTASSFGVLAGAALALAAFAYGFQLAETAKVAADAAEARAKLGEVVDAMEQARQRTTMPGGLGFG